MNNIFFLLIIFTSGFYTDWQTVYGSSKIMEGYAVQQTKDKGFIATGYEALSYLFDKDICIIKTDSLGKILWKTIYHESNNEYGYYIKELLRKGYLIVGKTESPNIFPSTVYFIYIDTTGNIKWSLKVNENSIGEVFEIFESNNNGFIIIGIKSLYTQSLSFCKKVIVQKTDSLGNIIWAKSFDIRSVTFHEIIPIKNKYISITCKKIRIPNFYNKDIPFINISSDTLSDDQKSYITYKAILEYTIPDSLTKQQYDNLWILSTYINGLNRLMLKWGNNNKFIGQEYSDFGFIYLILKNNTVVRCDHIGNVVWNKSILQENIGDCRNIHYYKNSKFVIVGSKKSDYGNKELLLQNLTEDNISPKRPKGFYVKKERDVLRLYWLKNNEPDLNGYNIYRRNSLYNFSKPVFWGNWIRVGTNNSCNDTTFNDINIVDGYWYQYGLTSFDSLINESAFLESESLLFYYQLNHGNLLTNNQQYLITYNNYNIIPIFNNHCNNVLIKVFDCMGRKIYEHKTMKLNGYSVKHILNDFKDINLSSGIYYISIKPEYAERFLIKIKVIR